MILNGLKDLEALVKEHNPSFAIDLYSCLTVQVENLHAVGHFKDQFPTLLQYAQNLANTVYESIKRLVPWSAYYFTHDKSYYPVLCQSTPLNAIPKLEHLKARRELNRHKKDLMIEWATKRVPYLFIFVIRENEILIAEIRDSLFFLFVNRARDPPCTTL